MTLVQISGLGDKICQLYMLMYYIGPAAVSLTLCTSPINHGNESRAMMLKAAGIAIIDLVAQTLNYSGATMAGPTIFAIIYSSVTVWTAVYSRILLKRKLNCLQWISIFIVFGGLTITAANSNAVGPDVLKGAILVIVGSSLHGMSYVLCEAIMVGEDVSARLSVEMNCAIQGVVPMFVYLFWQVLYTRRHFEERIMMPMNAAGTSIPRAICILFSLSVANLIHSLAFFYTLKNFPGGATSAGVMKGLQAVLVFVFTSIVYCGSIGGAEMCFTDLKFISLLVVTGGVLIFLKSTELSEDGKKGDTSSRNDGYSIVGEVDQQQQQQQQQRNSD